MEVDSETDIIDLPSPHVSSTSQDKLCVICNSPARCYYYGAMSCNACKMFFRRITKTLERIDRAVCRFGGRCDVTKDSTCRACRYKKCLKMGMKRIEKPTITEFMIQTPEDRYCKEIDLLLNIHAKTNRLRESTYNPTYFYRNVNEILQSSSELGKAEKYEQPLNWPYNPSVFLHNINIRDPFKIKLDRIWLVVDTIITIEEFKTMPFYSKLVEDDKVELLKQVAIVNTVFMERYYANNQKSPTLIYPDGMDPLKWMMFASYRRDPSKIELDAYCNSIEPLKRVDLKEVEYVILKAMIFCYSSVENMSENARVLLADQREKYAMIMLKHLQSSLGVEDGIKRYLEVISLIPTYFNFAQKSKQICNHIEMMKDPAIRNDFAFNFL